MQIKNLTRREKRLLSILIAVSSLALIYLFIITPFLEFRESSEDLTQKNLQEIEKLDSLYSEFRDIKQKKTKYMALLNNKTVNINTLIEQWSNTANISKNIADIRGSQSTVQNKYLQVKTDIKLDAVPIQKLIRFLYEIENSNALIKINYLKIYQGLKDSDTYDVLLKIDSFSLQQ